ncbi:hypothetical protein [Aneurinibacillus sp. REN35]|uniref:hypothetical protein n=1 Tax=Aneurinibacillus sp. REN35 TaxID=3237286 RepID=UPI003528ACB1
MKAVWWTRLFRQRHVACEGKAESAAWPDERELVHTLHQMKEKVRQAHTECMLDHDLYDECRYLLIRLDLLLPYALITPTAVKQRIIHLIMEDAAGILLPYLLLGEEGRCTARRDLLYALRYMTGEARRIIAAIQEYEREAFANQAAFVAKWSEKSKTQFGNCD